MLMDCYCIKSDSFIHCGDKWEREQQMRDESHVIRLLRFMSPMCPSIPEAFSFAPYLLRTITQIDIPVAFWLVLLSRLITSQLTGRFQKIRQTLRDLKSTARPLKPVYVRTLRHIIYNPRGWLMGSWTLLTPLDCVCVPLFLSLISTFFIFLIPFLGHRTDLIAAS